MAGLMAAARTYLFVPGNRPERFGKALASGADAVVLDLEDAVAADAKDAARAAVGAWAAATDPDLLARTVLRINDVGSEHHLEDLRLLVAARLPGVMLAKAEGPEQIAAVRAATEQAGTGTPEVLALVESARGVHRADAIACAEGVTRLVFGTLDFALDLDLDLDESADSLIHAAGRLTVASRIAGLTAPVAGVTPQLGDPHRLLADLAWARRHGFGAKLCIHPAQVGPVHTALAPDQQALDWARRVLAADDVSPGAARLDGRMIDRPVVLAARRTLARAGHQPLTP